MSVAITFRAVLDAFNPIIPVPVPISNTISPSWTNKLSARRNVSSAGT